MYAGYQHVYTLVYNEDGEYVDTVYPARGLRETTSIETSCAGGRLRGVAETVQQPTLIVDIEVEGNLVPAAVAGHFTFPKPEGCAGARKYYTCAVDNPAPEPDTPTELIAVTAVPHEGLFHVRWKGTGPVFDEFGNMRTDVALDASDEEPERWVRDETIYVKCLDGPVEDGVVHIEDLEPSDRKLKAQMARPTALLVQGYEICHEPVVSLPYAEHALWYLRYGREKVDHDIGPSEKDGRQELLNKIAENRFAMFILHAHGLGNGDSFVTLSEVEFPPANGEEDIPIQDRVYWADVALVNDRAYKLFYASSCKLGMLDSGVKWKNAFNAEASVTWDESVPALLCDVFDRAFWFSLITDDPDMKAKEPDAQSAFEVAMREAENHRYWNRPPSGILARPHLLGNTDLSKLKMPYVAPIPPSPW